MLSVYVAVACRHLSLSATFGVYAPDVTFGHHFLPRRAVIQQHRSSVPVSRFVDLSHFQLDSIMPPSGSLIVATTVRPACGSLAVRLTVPGSSASITWTVTSSLVLSVRPP